MIKLLDLLNEHIRPEDEVVVQLDTNATKEVEQVAIKYNLIAKYDYHRVWFPLNNDFASFKNNLKSKCNRDYIFQIDADEHGGDAPAFKQPAGECPRTAAAVRYIRAQP